jgi:hypothetical protein
MHKRESTGVMVNLRPAPSPPGERARRLLAESRLAAQEQLGLLIEAIENARGLAESIADGGPALYGPGPSDLSRRLAEELLWRGKTLQALTGRTSGAAPAPLRQAIGG